MNRPRVVACAALIAVALAPVAAGAKPSIIVNAATVEFSAASMAIVARGNARVDARGDRLTGDAAYVDLNTSRIVVAGNAHVTQHGVLKSADAIAVAADGTVSLLSVDDGTTAAAFNFPDLTPSEIYIRGRRAAITPHANVRLTPAAFPTSVGAFPVPTYLYTFTQSSGFAAQSLGGATFDQPYGLAGTPSSLLAAHIRYEDGPGLAIGLDHHLVDGDKAYLVTSLDVPVHDGETIALNGYRRIGLHATQSLDASANHYASYAHTAFTDSFGPAGARVDETLFSGGGSSFDFALRSPDFALPLHFTWRLRADIGFDSQRGGVYPQLTDRLSYQTVWRHGVDAFIASPQVRGPFRTSVSATADLARTWYDFPHNHDSISVSGSVAKQFSHTINVIGTYLQSQDVERYFQSQGVFYPTVSTLLTPDGSLYPGINAFSGAATARLYQVDLQYTPAGSTAFRVTFAHTNDFPQFAGYGRPPNEVRFDARLRPFPNIGVEIGRAYDFSWAGTRWVPRWTFAIVP